MVHILTGNIDDFIEKTLGRKVVCFGAGEHLDCIFKRFAKENLYHYVDMVADNKKELWGTVRHYKEKEYPVISFNELCAYAQYDQILILITNHWYFNEIIAQMDQEGTLDQTEVFVGDLLDIPVVDYPPFEIQCRKEEKIPRVIHYCWFGGGEIPAQLQAYMETWKACCPNYTIRRWDETNYNVTKNRYMKQAYDKKMWAFVSDYARVDIVHQYGGIYLDCDVELRKPLDVFLGEDLYCGFEDYRHIALGLGFGSAPGHPYLRSLLEYYENLTFVDDKGKLNLTACPVYQTEVIESYGIFAENRFQRSDRITAYPTEVFSPYSHRGIGKVTDKTYSIHHFSASWEAASERKKFAQWKPLLKRLMERIQEQQKEEKQWKN